MRGALPRHAGVSGERAANFFGSFLPTWCAFRLPVGNVCQLRLTRSSLLPVCLLMTRAFSRPVVGSQREKEAWMTGTVVFSCIVVVAEFASSLYLFFSQAAELISLLLLPLLPGATHANLFSTSTGGRRALSINALRRPRSFLRITTSRLGRTRRTRCLRACHPTRSVH